MDTPLIWCPPPLPETQPRIAPRATPLWKRGLDVCGVALTAPFLHSSPVIKLRELVESGALGSINYISSRRLNLGPVRKDVSALYDLAPHDISMMMCLLDQKPVSVTDGVNGLNMVDAPNRCSVSPI